MPHGPPDRSSRAPRLNRAGKALAETRTLSAIFVTIVIVWFVTADAARGAIVLRNQARELAAWLSVRDLGERFARHLAAMEAGERAASFQVEYSVGPQGGEGTADVPLSLRLPWPGDVEAERVALEVVAGAQRGGSAYRVYHVGARGTSLPLASYVIVLCPWKCPLRKDGEAAILVYPADGLPKPVSLRGVEAGLTSPVVDARPEPRGWAALDVLLGARGLAPHGECGIMRWRSRACLLQIDDPAVARFVTETHGASFNVSGVSVSAAIYPSAISFALGLLAFALVGPWLALRGAGAPDGGETWTMMARAPSPAGRLLALVQTLVALAVVVAPIAVAVSQARARDLLTPAEHRIWLASLPGLALAVLVLAGLAWELRRLRRLPPA